MTKPLLQFIWQKRALLILLLLGSRLQSSAQNSSYKLQSDLIFGVNSSKIDFNDQLTKRKFRPYIGWWGEKAFGANFSMNFSASYFFKASSISPSVELNWSGLEFSAFPTLNIDDFGFFAGPSLLINSAVDYDYIGLAPAEFKEETIELSSISLLAGMQFKLSEDFKMVMTHSIPFDDQMEYTFQIGVRAAIGELLGKDDQSRRQIRRRKAQQQVRQLNKGVLLVRLSNPKRQLDAMRAAKKDEAADRLQKRIHEQNKELIQAFRKRYNFSRVYFFYSENSREVIEGKRSGIFLNDSMEIDQSIQIPDSAKIFTAALGFRDQDSVQFFSEYRSEYSGSFEEKRVPAYYGGSENSFQALLLYDDQLKPLARPFPYYSRHIGNYFSRRPDVWLTMSPVVAIFSGLSMERSVVVLNSKLWRYWNKVNSTKD